LLEEAKTNYEALQIARGMLPAATAKSKLPPGPGCRCDASGLRRRQSLRQINPGSRRSQLQPRRFSTSRDPLLWWPLTISITPHRACRAAGARAMQRSRADANLNLCSTSTC